MLKMRKTNATTLPAGKRPRSWSGFGSRFCYRQVLQYVARWCSLLIFVGSYSPFGLATAALVGSLDPTHHVMVYTGGQGAAQLVLHHEGDCLRHQHGAAARFLTFFSQPARSDDPDHVLQFGSLESVQRCVQITAPPLPQQDPLSLAVIEVPAWSSVEPPCLTRFHPPPEPCGRLICARSTLLLL